MNLYLKQAIPLSIDNFTPQSRTPWGGHKICSHLKTSFFAKKTELVGESWEFSCDPQFPSHILGTKLTLAELLRNYPDEILGKNKLSYEILVKLIDAKEPLSLQLHPGDDDPHLKLGECGKPESWLILDAEEGAGVYLGFKEGTTKEVLQDSLRQGKNISCLLNFVEVAPFDYFEISPGVPHAIGSGVTLLEPQRSLPGNSGKTFRLWDWNRRYDQKGSWVSAGGHPRELHVREGLRLINLAQHSDSKFLSQLQKHPQVFSQQSITVRSYPANSFYQTYTIDGLRGTVCIDCPETFGIFVLLKGVVMLENVEQDSQQEVRSGQTCLLPCSAFPLRVSASEDFCSALIVPSVGGFCVKIEII